MTERHFILATAGHVDHGKTALVRALTGIDTDRLPEEKARGITIDLGFAHLALPSTVNHQAATISLGLIDVPGHEDFIRTMIAGVGSIDLALLVVAADDGWMPQTEEHLQILAYLRVRRLVVAITKSDLGNAEVVARQARAQLAETDFQDAPIVLTSVRAASGLAELRLALTSEFVRLAPARDIGKPRLFVDRAFSLRGIGTVVTGTLIGGSFGRGEEVAIWPGNKRSRIRSIQNHGREIETAQPAMRTAFNLADISLEKAAGVARGDVLTKAELGLPSATLDVELMRSARARGETGQALKHGAGVYLHHGTRRYRARVLFLERVCVVAGERALAQLRLEEPAFAFIGDRFVLRDPSERRTIAGGVVLDADADRRNFRTAALRSFLAARAAAPNDILTFLRTELARDGVRESKSLLIKSSFSNTGIEAAKTKLVESGELVRHGTIVADASWWAKFKDEAAVLVDTAHRAQPDRAGLDLSSFRTAFGGLPLAVIDAVIFDLSSDGFEQIGKVLKRVSHRPTLPPALQPIAAQIRATLAANPFDPPSRKELSPDRDAQQALQFLLQAGEAIELAPEVVLRRESFEQMKSATLQYLAQGTVASAGELRQHLATSRRIVIPFLERLDREGLTIREGDRRRLRAPAPVR